MATRRSARLAAAAASAHQQHELYQHQCHTADEDSCHEQQETDAVVPGVKELAEMTCRQMRLKLFGAAAQSTDRSETNTERSSTVAMPDVLLLDPSTVSMGVNNRGGGGGHLSSSLDPGVSEELYFDLSTETTSCGVQRYTPHTDDPHQQLMKKTVISSDFEKQVSAPPIYQSLRKLKKMKKVEREGTTGRGWFNMPAPEVTPEMKNDLRVLQMRDVLDRSHHYKSSDWKKGKLPKYFQVGTMVSGAAEFYSARIPKKQRKRTIVEELLADEQLRSYNKKKVTELQKKFQSGTHRYRHMKKKRKNRHTH